jgi:hypothetical protein
MQKGDTMCLTVLLSLVGNLDMYLILSVGEVIHLGVVFHHTS